MTCSRLQAGCTCTNGWQGALVVIMCLVLPVRLLIDWHHCSIVLHLGFLAARPPPFHDACLLRNANHPTCGVCATAGELKCFTRI